MPWRPARGIPLHRLSIKQLLHMLLLLCSIIIWHLTRTTCNQVRSTSFAAPTAVCSREFQARCRARWSRCGGFLIIVVLKTSCEHSARELKWARRVILLQRFFSGLLRSTELCQLWFIRCACPSCRIVLLHRDVRRSLISA